MSIYLFRCLRSLSSSQFDFQNLDSGQHPSASLTKAGKREEKNSAQKKHGRIKQETALAFHARNLSDFELRLQAVV